MIRDHVIATIEFSYTAERWPTDNHGERAPGASEFFPGQRQSWTVIAPSKEVAGAWAERKGKFMKDFAISNIMTIRPDAAIIELTW